MNASRVRHLLGFEWKRSKWLIFFGWLFLTLAFVPRLMTSARLWKMEWSNTAGYLSGLGLLLYGLLGLQLALRLSLMSRDWRGSRPLLAREMILVKVLLQGAGFILPMLLLSWINLTLAGFATSLVWQNLGAIALGVIPLWWVWGLTAHYSGRVKTLVKIALILMLLNYAAAFSGLGLVTHWTDLAGSYGTVSSWFGIWITAICLISLWPVCRRRSEGFRMSTVVISALVGGGASFWMLQNERLLRPHEELPAEVNWEGNFFTARRAGNLYAGFPLTYQEQTDGSIVVWQSIDGLETISGTEIHANPSFISSANLVTSRISQEWLKKRLLPEGGTIESWNETSSDFEQLSESQTLGGVIGRVSDDRSRIGDEAVFSGRIRGAIVDFEKLCELEMGTDGHFRSNEMIGEIQWDLRKFNRGSIKINIRTSFTKSGLLGSGKGQFEAQSRLRSWLVYLYYPNSKILQAASSAGTRLGSQLGGMSEDTTGFSAGYLHLREGAILNNEKPRLVIYRPRVLKSGYVDVTSPKLVRMNQDQESRRAILSKLSGPYKDRSAIEEMKEERPNPDSATQAEVGGWLRRSKNTDDYAAKIRDYAEYADQWGRLLVETPGPWNGESYALGARNQAKEDLINQLGEVDWAPQVLVERGWEAAARDRVERLVKEKPNNEKSLSLGLMLELEGVEDLVIDKLSRDGSTTLYEIARQVPEVAKHLEAAMGARTEVAKKEFGQSLSFSVWAVPLRHGKKESLEKFFDAILRTQRARRDGWIVPEVAESFEVSGKGSLFEILGKLSADDFKWDALARKWVIEKKGERKE